MASQAVSLNVKWVGIDKLDKLVSKAGLAAPYAIAKAMDEVGRKTTTQIVRATAKQAGVKYGRAKSVINTRQAMGAGSGEFVIIARDVTLSLKEFGPREGRKGVSAAPWGKRRIFAHTFIGPNGHVFVRRTKARLPIRKLFGPAIPKEMVKDQAEQTFYAYTAAALPAALEKWLFRQL